MPSSKAAVKSFIPVNDDEWWAEWKARIKKSGKPVLGKVNITFVRIQTINHSLQQFQARIRIDCEIESSSSDRSKNQADEAPTRYYGQNNMRTNKFGVTSFLGYDGFVEEFLPKLVIVNLKSEELFSRWIRRDKKDTIIHCLEVNGWFGVKADVFRCPMDTEKLKIEVTSDWDKERLVFEIGSVSQFRSPEDSEISREFSFGPGVLVDVTENVSGKGIHYSQIEAGVLITRKNSLIKFFSTVFPPLSVATLGFSQFYLVPSDCDAKENANILTDRLSIGIVLMLANTIEVQKSFSALNFLDFHTAAAYVILVFLCLESCIVLGPSTIPLESKLDADNKGFRWLLTFWIFVNLSFCLIAAWWFVWSKYQVTSWKQAISQSTKLAARSANGNGISRSRKRSSSPTLS